MRRLLYALGVLLALTASPAAAEPFCMTWTIPAPPKTVLTSVEIVGEGSQYFALAGRAAITEPSKTVSVRGLIGSLFVSVNQDAVLSFPNLNPDGTQGIITLFAPSYTSGLTGNGASVSVVTCPGNFPSPTP